MKINEYKKLEKYINSYDFNKSYNGVNQIGIALSYFGNVASIFLAYFFLSKILGGVIENQVVVILSSIIILTCIELLKRSLFRKFSIQSLKDNTITRAAMPLFIASVLIILISFYSSVTGAREFSNRSKQMETTKTIIVNKYSDSITSVYAIKISEIENEIKANKEKKIEKENEKALLAQTIQTGERNYTKGQRERNKQLDQEIKDISVENVSLENQIKSKKEERDQEIKKYDEKLSKDTEVKKQDNSKNSIFFVIISTLIELIILGGVYFSEYFKFRSYKDFKEKIQKDPNYQKWVLYEQILSVVITDETKINEKLPAIKVIVESCKVSDVLVTPKDVSDFFKVMLNLGIIKTSGSVKYINKTRDIATDILKKHFNIE